MIAIQPNLFALKSVLTEEDKLNDDNYTPDYIVKPFRELVGGFDLDPFSCERANQIVKASNFWAKSDDAFSQDWSKYKNKWVNPPYSKGNIDRAVEYVLHYSHIGNTFLLTNSNTSSHWFQIALNSCNAYLLFNHRIEFTNPKNDELKKDSGNAKGQTLFYFGKRNLIEFKQSCQHLGTISIAI